MGVHKNNLFELTIACAFIDRHISDIDDYLNKKTHLITLVKEAARKVSNKQLDVIVNTADDPVNESIYLTVTGTSAESGDDGEVGRGNRVNGLITPYRPMNMEAAAGKNPVTHVGKLYNIVAQQIADTLVNELDEVNEAYCYLLSQIGSPVSEPKVIDLRLGLHDAKISDRLKEQVEEITHVKLSGIYKIRQELISGQIHVF
jgi:S-adenosylmethionine synthetase